MQNVKERGAWVFGQLNLHWQQKEIDVTNKNEK